MQKEAKTELTRQKLLDAVDSLITDSEDPIKVTSRQIAAVSGVQPAMINYCFGSRERLIYEVFLRKYEAALSDAKVQKIVESSLSPKDKLKKLHFVIASFLVKNYSFTKASSSSSATCPRSSSATASLRRIMQARPARTRRPIPNAA